MWGLFKSREAAEKAEMRSAVIRAIRENVSGMELEIRHIQTKLEVKHQKYIAHRVRTHVIFTERTAEAAERMSTGVKKCFDAGREPEGFALMLSSRLIISGVLLLKLSGRDWIDASFEFVALEGVLRGFIESCGYRPWPELYVQDVAFERYRLDCIAKKEAADAAILAEFERESDANGANGSLK